MKIANKDLKLEDIPETFKSVHDIFDFAHSSPTHPGIKKENRFKLVKRIRKSIKAEDVENFSLSDLRLSIFFYFRGLHWSGGGDDEAGADSLKWSLKIIKEKVAKGEIE
ncbi:MAG: hypothetical protein ACI85O_000218 [Saprospiraceae bacterium]|jgi:hypothetical protein